METRYKNGNLRTDIYYRKGKIDSVFLYDSLGNIQGKNDFTSNSPSTLNYFKTDSSDWKLLNTNEMDRKLDPWIKKIEEILGKEDDCGTYAAFRFWVNSEGQVEHVIIFQNYYLHYSTAEKILSAAEETQFGKLGIKSGIVFNKKVVFYCRQ